MDSRSPLDHAAVERLRRLGDAGFVCHMIDLFFSFVSQKLSEARTAQDAGDLLGVGRAAHAVKSTAGNAGAWRVQDLAVRLEQAANGGHVDQVESLLPRLEEAFVEVKPLLEAVQAGFGDASR